VNGDGSMTLTGRLAFPSRRCAGAALLTILLAAPAVLLFARAGLSTSLQYDRARIATGELWRVITCHWTHWSQDHLSWDLAMFVVLLLACWRFGRLRLFTTLCAAAVLIPFGVWVSLPQMQFYRGLSGLDSALFMLLAVGLLRGDDSAVHPIERITICGLLVGFAGKMLFEVLTGETLFVETTGFVAVPLAHLIGGVCGVLAAFATSPPDHTPAASGVSPATSTSST
jgi:rhomboid family GlyGly-CTERM serine protease